MSLILQCFTTDPFPSNFIKKPPELDYTPLECNKKGYTPRWIFDDEIHPLFATTWNFYEERISKVVLKYSKFIIEGFKFTIYDEESSANSKMMTITMMDMQMKQINKLFEDFMTLSI